jgi:hypothetical protein
MFWGKEIQGYQRSNFMNTKAFGNPFSGNINILLLSIPFLTYYLFFNNYLSRNTSQPKSAGLSVPSSNREVVG